MMQHTKYQDSEAPIPQSLRPWRDLSSTDFDCFGILCKHFDCLFDHWYGRGLVSDQSHTDRRTFGDRLTISRRSVADRSAIGQRQIGERSATEATGWRLFYHQILRNKVFVRDKTTSVKVAIMIIYKIKLFCLQQIRTLQV